MANVHFSIPDTDPAGNQFEMIAMQGAAAAVVAALEAKTIHAGNIEQIENLISSVKKALLA
jgi:hypothetical protein